MVVVMDPRVRRDGVGMLRSLPFPPAPGKSRLGSPLKLVGNC